MSEKRKTLGFYGIIEFGDYLHNLAPAEHSFQMEDPAGKLVNCSREEVLRKFQMFCGEDEDKFRVRIIHSDPGTGMTRQWDKILRRNKPPSGFLGMLRSAFMRSKQPGNSPSAFRRQARR